MSDMKSLFQQIENNLLNELKRVHVNSSLKVFYGINFNKQFSISFISKCNPTLIESTREIKVRQGKEAEGVYWTCFDLENDEVKDVFFLFCDSLIESIDNVTNDLDALNALQDRFYSWKLLLKNKGKMPYEVYQGLYGELYFLKEHLFKELGAEKAVLAWVGPDGYSKDFSLDDTWFEVKTIGTSSTSVKINSLAQLDSEVNGHLVVVVVEKMAEQFDNGYCSVQTLYRAIIEEIESHEIRENFINKVLKYGYVDEDNNRNRTKFEVKKINHYSVDQKFPKLTKDSINVSAISKVTYEIMINAIDKFMEGDK